jgi:hypothetical protein
VDGVTPGQAVPVWRHCWIDRINAAIVRRISGKTTQLVDEQGIEQAGQRLAWSGLERAIAYRHPSLVGDDLAVALDFGESRIVVVSENDEAWKTVLAALDAHPRSRQRSPEWTIALVAGSPEARIELV